MPATIPSSESALPWLSVTDLRVGAKPVAPSSALVDGSWAPRPKALGFRFRRRSQWLGHRLLLQRVIEHFVERVDVVILISPRISGVRSATTLGSLYAGSSTSLITARLAP